MGASPAVRADPRPIFAPRVFKWTGLNVPNPVTEGRRLAGR